MHARGFARPPKPFAKNCPIKAPLLLSGRALKFIGHAATSFASRGWHGNPFSTVWKMDSLLPTNFSRSFPRVYTRPPSLSLSLSLFSFFFFFYFFWHSLPWQISKTHRGHSTGKKLKSETAKYLPPFLLPFSLVLRDQNWNSSIPAAACNRVQSILRSTSIYAYSTNTRKICTGTTSMKQ